MRSSVRGAGRSRPHNARFHLPVQTPSRNSIVRVIHRLAGSSSLSRSLSRGRRKEEERGKFGRWKVARFCRVITPVVRDEASAGVPRGV